jgi:hypothetical protein
LPRAVWNFVLGYFRDKGVVMDKESMDADNELSGSPLQEFERNLQALLGESSDWGFKKVPSIPLIVETLRTVIDTLIVIKNLEVMREPENKAEYDCKIELITLTEQLVGMKKFLIEETEI